MNYKTKVVGGRVANEVADRLVEISQEEKVSKSEIIERALRAYDDVRLLCLWGDISPEECCRQLGDMFRDGQLVITNGELQIVNGEK